MKVVIYTQLKRIIDKWKKMFYKIFRFPEKWKSYIITTPKEVKLVNGEEYKFELPNCDIKEDSNYQPGVDPYKILVALSNKINSDMEKEEERMGLDKRGEKLLRAKVVKNGNNKYV